MKSRYNIFLCGIMAAASLLLAGCSVFPEEEVFETAMLVKEDEKNEFHMVTVQRGDVCDFRRIPCKYRESNTQDIELGREDIVNEIYVKKGDTVKKGDILLSLGSEDYDNQIEEYKYQIRVKETLIKQDEKNKRLELEKQKIVLNDKTMIKAIVERYDSQIDGHRSDLELLKMRLNRAQADKESAQIRAEMDGKVTFLDTMLFNRMRRFGGDYSFAPWDDMEDSLDYALEGALEDNPEAVAHNTLMIISDGSKPRFTGSLKALDVQLADGQQIDVVCDGNTYQTTVTFKDKETVHFMLDTMPDDLKDKTEAYAKYIVNEKKDVLYLPDDAVTSMGEETIVYMEDENGFKKPVKVQAGLTADNRTEIISGLQEGDVVILR